MAHTYLLVPGKDGKQASPTFLLQKSDWDLNAIVKCRIDSIVGSKFLRVFQTNAIPYFS